MKLLKLVFLFIFFSSIVYAQPFYKYGSFVIKGHVENHKEPMFDVSITTYFWPVQKTIKVLTDGSFEQVLPIQNIQQIIFGLHDEVITFTVHDKDTITLEWNEADTQNNLFIKGKNKLRTEELQAQLKSGREYNKQFFEVLKKLRTAKLPVESQYKLVNNLYNRQVQAIFDSSGFWSKDLEYWVISIYFKYTSLLVVQHLTPHYKLKFIQDSSKKYPYIDLFEGADYTQLTEDWFWNVPEYRACIENYTIYTQQEYQPFQRSKRFSNTAVKPFNPTLDQYYLALTNFDIIGIRDWYITSSIIHGFGQYDFADVEKVYKQAASTLNTPYLKDTLQKYYTAIKRLRPGSVAPGFSLKNDKGQTVSLRDFRGKVVYIDFWGVTCKPCIAEIENANPALHQHYENKGVVFLNICVDAKKDEWKDAIEKHKLDGVNLIAEGWSNHPACKAYNVTEIPHYVLIDKSGNIANSNAPTASMLNLMIGKNEIDLLLK